MSIFCLSVFACKDFSSFHCTKSPEPSEGLVLISRTWPSDDGHRPVPTPGCVFGKVGPGRGTSTVQPHCTVFPAHWFPKSVKMCLEQALSILAFGEGGCHPPAPIPGEKGCVCVVSSLSPTPRFSQAEGRAGPDFSQGKRGMLFNYHPSPQAGALLVIKDTKAGLLLGRKPSAAAGVGS